MKPGEVPTVEDLQEEIQDYEDLIWELKNANVPANVLRQLEYELNHLRNELWQLLDWLRNQKPREETDTPR